MLRPILAAGLVALALAAGYGVVARDPLPLPETVTIPGGTQIYRASGEYRIGTRRIDAPAVSQQVGPLHIMKYQVTQEDYARCMADGACLEVAASPGAQIPQTGVSWSDATAYADWLSDRTGLRWRLPTDAEWLRAAAERGFDGALGAEGANPADRWLASYRSEVERRGEADLTPRPTGHFGATSTGMQDAAGNVWEWTDSCDERVQLAEDGQTRAIERFCGVRVAQGKHRAFVVDFVRDARSGGCAAGVPPDFLGFRLVRED